MFDNTNLPFNSLQLYPNRNADSYETPKTIKVKLEDTLCTGIQTYAELNTDQKISFLAKRSFKEAILEAWKDKKPYILGLLTLKLEDRPQLSCSWMDGEELYLTIKGKKVNNPSASFFILYPTGKFLFKPLKWDLKKIESYFSSKVEGWNQLALHHLSKSMLSYQGTFFLKQIQNDPSINIEDAGKFLLSFAALMKCEGHINKVPGSMTYVKVDDKIIQLLSPFLTKRGFSEPPFFGNGGVGAHISLITRAESQEKVIDVSMYMLTKVNFTIKDLKIVEPPNWKGVKKVALLEVDCPELKQIRLSLGLSELSNGFEFHITIAIIKS